MIVSPDAAGVFPGRLVVDLDAIADNAAELARRADGAAVMAVVKANAYGHGLVPSALAALSGGATFLGAAQLSEALALRAGLEAACAVGGGLDLAQAAGSAVAHSGGSAAVQPDGPGLAHSAGLAADDGAASPVAQFTGPDRAAAWPILSWLYGVDAPFAQALAARIDLGVSAPWALDAIAQAARQTGLTARLHLKIDTGLSRAGASQQTWGDLVDQALRLEAEGAVRVVGCWSHFAYADDPTHPTVRRQQEIFEAAWRAATAQGARFEWRHLANSAALLTGTGVTYDMVRPGLALYGLSPVPARGSAADFGLRPAMRLESSISLVKQVGAGQGVSYGHTYTTPIPTTLGLIPLGYADGIPRHASNTGPLAVGGQRLRIAGRVCMDQFVVDLGPEAVHQAGDQVILFGDGSGGEPTAQDWADAAGTISYEIVTRMPPHLPRLYTGATARHWGLGG